MPFDFPDSPNCSTEELRLNLKNVLFPLIPVRPILATIGTSETMVAHGLGQVPTGVRWFPRGDARVWRSKAPNETHVFLIASTSVDVDIEVTAA